MSVARMGSESRAAHRAVYNSLAAGIEGKRQRRRNGDGRRGRRRVRRGAVGGGDRGASRRVTRGNGGAGGSGGCEGAASHDDGGDAGVSWCNLKMKAAPRWLVTANSVTSRSWERGVRGAGTSRIGVSASQGSGGGKRGRGRAAAKTETVTSAGGCGLRVPNRRVPTVPSVPMCIGEFGSVPTNFALLAPFIAIVRVRGGHSFLRTKLRWLRNRFLGLRAATLGALVRLDRCGPGASCRGAGRALRCQGQRGR